MAEGRGGRAPLAGASGPQPPEMKLSSREGCGVIGEREAEKREGMNKTRPRSGTDVAAAWEGVGRGGRGLFLSGRDSRR